MTVSVDPSSAPLLGSVGPDRFLEWTGGVDLLFPNLTEGSVLTGEEDPDRILEKLLPYYPAVVLKLGPNADTTGAGDAFCAGFLAAWLDGGPPAEALLRGAGLAGRAVGRVGARPTV
jgi:sugar/nucleoside kinase (ribokinase family)